MLDKRGQITLFIFAGIVVLLVVGTLLFFNYRLTKEKLPEEKILSTLDVTKIKNYIDSCIEKTGNDAIDLVSKQGGYYALPEDSIYNTAYYFYLGEPLIPPITTIESELSSYMEDRLPLCIEDFKPFKEQGFDITAESLHAAAIIGEKDVLFNIDYPIIIKKRDSIAEMDKFSLESGSSLKKMYDAAAELIEKQQQDPDFILISEIIDIGDKYNITFDTEEDDEGNVIYHLVDREPSISEFPELEPEEKHYEFLFAARYKK